MKIQLFFLTVIMAVISSCTAPPGDNNNNNEDTSPGVDEYFKVDINGHHWELNDDEPIAAVLNDFGSGPVYGMSVTNVADTTHFFYSIPYFHSNDTTWDLSSVPPNMAFQFHTDSLYTTVSSGNLHIVRTNVNSMEVFTGTFHYVGNTVFNTSSANFNNGEFVIARIL
jgi:hypothetical protein